MGHLISGAGGALFNEIGRTESLMAELESLDWRETGNYFLLSTLLRECKQVFATMEPLRVMDAFEALKEANEKVRDDTEYLKKWNGIT